MKLENIKKDLLDVPNKRICPKCKSIVKDMFGDKKTFPRWKTKVKGKAYECRHCGFIKEIQNRR